MYSDPIAYFISFRSYGTWLHGDERGSVDPKHNAFGQPRIGPDRKLELRDRSNLAYPPVLLDGARREVIERTIREVCVHRGWKLTAINVRTNHVHSVVGARASPERIMNDFKAWATRRMVEAGVLAKDVKAWVRHGSTRYIWNQDDLAKAVEYVVNGQGEDLPGTDSV